MGFIERVAIVVDDYDEAIAFFVGTLGFELEEDSPARTTEGRAKRWVVVRPPGGETGILLARADGPDQEAVVGRQAAGRVGFFLRVDDFEVPSEGGDPDEEIDPGVAAVSWPDGRTVMIRSRGVSQDELRRVVDNIAAGTGQDLDRLHAAIGERLAALPLVWQAALPSGTVEMRDGGGDDRAACLHLPGREPACGWLGFTPDTEGPDLGVVQASVTIDGTWYALAVGTRPVELTSEDPLNPTTLVLANETGTDGSYYFGLALPPPEMQHVGLHLDGGLLSYLSRPETEYFPAA